MSTSRRTIADSLRAIEMMANNARLAQHIKTELRRIAQELRDIQQQQQREGR